MIAKLGLGGRSIVGPAGAAQRRRQRGTRVQGSGLEDHAGGALWHPAARRARPPDKLTERGDQRQLPTRVMSRNRCARVRRAALWGGKNALLLVQLQGAVGSAQRLGATPRGPSAHGTHAVCEHGACGVGRPARQRKARGARPGRTPAVRTLASAPRSSLRAGARARAIALDFPWAVALPQGGTAGRTLLPAPPSFAVHGVSICELPNC